MAGYSQEQTQALLNNISKVGKLRKTKIMANRPESESYGTPMTIEYSDGVRTVYSVYELVDKKLNCFTGWECSIGVDVITIQSDLIYRGVCRTGGIIGNIHDEDFGFVLGGVICKSKWCSCLLDVQESRFNPQPSID